jgi:quinol monooxygenase YgiN
MKRFIIQYTFGLDAEARDEWHRQIAAFIVAIDADPELRGNLRYRVTRARDGAEYFHHVDATEDAVHALNQREFFARYTAETKRVAAGTLRVIGLESVAETVASAS